MNVTNIIFIFSVLFCLKSSGQVGYSKKYDFDKPSSSFTGMVLLDDTLNVFGVHFHDSIQNRQGIFFAKLDTNGTVLNFTSYFDPLGDDYATQINSSIIKLSGNNGFAMIGIVLARANGFLLIVDNNGNSVSYHEYFDSTSTSDLYEKLVEVPDGLLICGTKFDENNKPCVFLSKLKKDGTKVWEKKYDSPARDWYFNSIYMMDTNSYVLGISSVSPAGTSIANLNSQTIILSVDNTGEENWRWESDITLEEGGAGSLQKTVDNNWIYLSARTDIHPQQLSWTHQPKIIERDSNFELIWEKTFGASSSNENQFVTLKNTPDNKWIAAGSLKDPNIPNSIVGSICMLSGSGDSLWCRLDTLIYYTNSYTSHKISEIAVLPSGSIIACGSIDDFSPIGRTYAWLLKVNNDGCIDSSNCVSLPVHTPQGNLNEIVLFPNPATEYFTLKFPNNSQSDSFEISIVDIYNHLVYRKIQSGLDKNWAVWVDNWDNGIYFVRITAIADINVSKTFKVVVLK